MKFINVSPLKVPKVSFLKEESDDTDKTRVSLQVLPIWETDPAKDIFNLNRTTP